MITLDLGYNPAAKLKSLPVALYVDQFTCTTAAAWGLHNITSWTESILQNPWRAANYSYIII